jgi:hypothetical protein
MKVLYDHQAFVMQKYGGISRYFNEIMKLGRESIDISTIDPDLFINKPPASTLQLKTGIISRYTRFFKRKSSVDEPKIIPLEASRFPEKVTELITKGEFDIFHPTYYDPYFLNHTNKPFVLTVYDMIHEIYKEYFSISNPTSRDKLLLCRKANQIITEV